MNRRQRLRSHCRSELLEPRALLTSGANLALYEFTDNRDGNQDLASTDQHLETTASDISSALRLGWTGNGEPPNGLALGGAWNETTEPTPAGGQPDFFEFTITPDNGYSMNVATFGLQARRNDPDSKNSFSVYFDEDPGSGGDNFSTKILTGVLNTEDQFERFEVNVEAMPEFADITTPLTFRVYSWGTAGTGTQRMDNIRVQGMQETVSGSAHAYYGDADRLITPLDELGNRVADFSSVGYKYGNEPIPDVTALVNAANIVNVSPTAGDDMANIQAAIDQVEVMPLDENGLRGIVQLSAGEFEISDQVQILESGVILRGVGDGSDPAANTILRGTGTHQRSLILAGPSTGHVSPQSGTTQNIIDKYVPVGATSFEVDAINDNWAVGDEVVVFRPSTAEWIAAIGMDNIPPRDDGSTIQWAPGGNYDQPYERVITRIEGNRVFVNAPITNAIEQQYGGGTIYKYSFPRINHVGVENLRGVSDFASDTDEDHAWTFIELGAVEHSWVTNVTGLHFGYATVHATGRSRLVTVDDAVSLDPKSIITGARRYPFVIDGQLTLMQNLYSEEGRHDFVNNSSWRNRGPNVFLNGTAVNSHSSTGPHQRWSTGTLYDTISTDNQIEARNRGNFGTGHGWGGANFVFWNTTATGGFIVQNPPTAQNWVIGGTGTLINETRFGPQPPATVDAHETPIDFGRADNPTSSLYVAQHNQRTEFDWERREYVLGDYDAATFDGAASADDVFVDTAWLNDVAALAGGTAVNGFDVSDAAQFVPATFQFDVDTGEGVMAAVLTLGLRGTDGDTTDDRLWLDDLAAARTFASLGLTDSLATDATTPVTIELTGSDLARLLDGRLNLAVDNNTVLDWASLDMMMADQLSVTIGANSVSENAGSAATTGTVTRTGDLSDAITVTLTSDRTDKAVVPASVVIPAGQASASFDIDAVDNSVIDGTHAVVITATTDSHAAGQQTLSVTDNDTADRDVFVAPDGHDNNPGTLAEPFATIARGMDVVQPGFAVQLRAGTYRETIEAVRSGTADQPITIQNYNDEEVFISAADVVSSSWAETAPGSGIFVTPVDQALPTSFWSPSNATANGSGASERGGSAILSVANEGNSRIARATSQQSSDAWNFFEQPVTWSVRGMSFDSVGSTDFPAGSMNGYFTIMSENSAGWNSNDSVSVQARGNGQISLRLNKNTSNDWGVFSGSITDPNVTGFDLTLQPGAVGEVDYSLIAVPTGQTIGSGSWEMTQADWSDGGDGSTSFLQLFAQESQNASVDPTQRFEWSIDSVEVSAGGQVLLDEQFDNNDLSSITGTNVITRPESVTVTDAFWQTNPIGGNGAGIIEDNGRLLATVVNDGGFQSATARSAASFDEWNFFERDVTLSARDISFASTGATAFPLDRGYTVFSLATGTNGGWGSDDSVNVRLDGDGELRLQLNKDATSSWGTQVGSVTDASINGFDLEIGPGAAGFVDYTLTAVPTGQSFSGSWEISASDWSDGADGRSSYLYAFAQEAVADDDASQQLQVAVESLNVVTDRGPVFADDFNDGDIVTVPREIFITSGYDQLFIDGEMQWEARHVNKTSADVLDADAADVTLNNQYLLSSDSLAGQPDNYYAGARFLGKIPQAWSWQTSIVDSSSGNQAQLSEANASTWWWPNQLNASSGDGSGYLYGKREFIDTDGEWVVQHNPTGPDQLYLQTPGGTSPSNHLIERKVRNWTVNINGHNHIVVSGLNLRGGAVRMDGEGLVLEHSDGRYMSHYLTFERGARVDGGRPEGGGVVVSGNNNIVRHNTLYETAGSGVVATGSEHLITRNHIHDVDYSGTYATGVSLSGRAHTATFNTIHDAGRDVLRPTGPGMTVMYNDLSKAGRMALDLGVIYTYGHDGFDPVSGQRTRIAYNWIYDNGDPHHANVGVYLDNYTRNYDVDHNVFWNIGLVPGVTEPIFARAVFINSPTLGNRIVNNTFVGVRGHQEGTWTAFPDGNEGTFWTTDNHGMDMLTQNNLFIDPATDFDTVLQDFAGRDFRLVPASPHIDPTLTTDLVEWQTTNGSTNVPPDFRLNMRERNQPFFFRDELGTGVEITGLTDGFTGSTPDSGAYESGLPRWIPGVSGAADPALTIELPATQLRETDQVLATVTRNTGIVGDLVVTLNSSDTNEASVPASITIPDGVASATFSVTGIDDDVLDASETVVITASAGGHLSGTASVSVEDILSHRMSNLTVRVQDQFGNPLPDATVDVNMTQHGFKFGTQVRDRMFAITQTEFDSLSDNQKQSLLPNLEPNFGIPRITPTWTDIQTHRDHVLANFNHVVPTTGLQWIAIENNGTPIPDAALSFANANGLTTTAASVVWQKERWPTPEEYRPEANPDAQEFHDALIAARLSANGVLTQFSESGTSPNITDWKLLNEPLHEHYYADTFVDAGIYESEVAALTDYFVRADTLRPDVTLSINEYALLNSANDDFTIQYRDLINDLLAAGAPIDRIGVQAHMARNDVTRDDIVRRLNILAETGLPIEISEFDARDDAAQLTPAEQEQLFRNILEASFENPSVDGFIMWGIWDTAHWRGNAPLFDADWNLKPEAAPWTDLVRGEWMSTYSDAAVDASGNWKDTVGVFNGIYNVTATSGSSSSTVTDVAVSSNSELVVTIIVPAADLLAETFDVLSDHVVEGKADVSFTVTNVGSADAESFETHLVWSPNEILGDADDVIVAGSQRVIPGLVQGSGHDVQMSVQLDRAALLQHSLAVDPAGGHFGAVSADSSRLFLVIDATNAVPEIDETNNSGVGHLVDSDDISYFPWDIDGNGAVSPLDALRTIAAIGTNSPRHDLAGKGVVSPLDALAVLQRIGLRYPESVTVDAPDLAASNLVSAQPALAVPLEENRVGLFDDYSSDIAEPSDLSRPDDSNASVDDVFTQGDDWLSVI